jgi:hypothetical protein
VATATVVSHAIADFWAELAASDLSPDKRSAHIEALVELLESAGGAPASTGAGAANSTSDTDAIQDNPAREADALAAGLASSISIQAKVPRSTLGDARATLKALFHALPAAGPELGICLGPLLTSLERARAERHSARHKRFCSSEPKTRHCWSRQCRSRATPATFMRNSTTTSTPVISIAKSTTSERSNRNKNEGEETPAQDWSGTSAAQTGPGEVFATGKAVMTPPYARV